MAKHKDDDDRTEVLLELISEQLNMGLLLAMALTARDDENREELRPELGLSMDVMFDLRKRAGLPIRDAIFKKLRKRTTD